MPFENPWIRNFHHEKHKKEFAFATDFQYEAEADKFMAGVPIPPARECHRKNGDRVRFNRTTKYLAVEAKSGYLKTFHKPSEKYIALGYFSWECGQVRVDDPI